MRAITFSFFGIARSNQFCWIAIQPNWQRRKGSKNLFKPWEWNKGTWRIKTHMKFGMWKLNLIWIEYSWRVSLTLTVLVFGEGVCEFQLKLLGQHNLFQFTFRCGKMESLSTRLHQSTKSVPTDEKKNPELIILMVPDDRSFFTSQIGANFIWNTFINENDPEKKRGKIITFKKTNKQRNEISKTNGKRKKIFAVRTLVNVVDFPGLIEKIIADVFYDYLTAAQLSSYCGPVCYLEVNFISVI